MKGISSTSSTASEILRIVYFYSSNAVLKISEPCWTSIAFSTALNIVPISSPQHTPLHIAVKEFQVHTVEALVVSKADINSQDKDGVINYMITVYILPLV